MNIRFVGGARTVTGSQHLLSVNGKRILLECGLFQGRRKETFERNRSFQYDPRSIDAVLLSHAHIDHSGNLPNLVKGGFRGPVYATTATVDLLRVMLADSAHLQERDAEWVNKARRRDHQPAVEPLYSLEDVERAMSQAEGVAYGHVVEVMPGVTAVFRDAGHILGSAGICLEMEEKGRTARLGFTGDIGRPGMPILRDPDALRDLDVLVIETTYGNRLHGPREDVEEELARTVGEVAGRGGKIIIPAFAVGRTQLLVYILHKLFNENRIPDMPVFVDSPLASAATEVFRRHPECFDRETSRVFPEGQEDPFGFGRLTYVHDVEESKKLNDLACPHIIISASGMAEAGRVLHHLLNGIGNPRNLVLMVGYAAENTLARRLMDGEKKVRIYGEERAVMCGIKTMDAFSAHADRRELLDYATLNPPQGLKKVFLVHGEEDQALPFRDTLKSKGFKSVEFPAAGDIYDL